MTEVTAKKNFAAAHNLIRSSDRPARSFQAKAGLARSVPFVVFDAFENGGCLRRAVHDPIQCRRVSVPADAATRLVAAQHR
jgi:hypothetical protein